MTPISFFLFVCLFCSVDKHKLWADTFCLCRLFLDHHWWHWWGYNATAVMFLIEGEKKREKEGKRWASQEVYGNFNLKDKRCGSWLNCQNVNPLSNWRIIPLFGSGIKVEVDHLVLWWPHLCVFLLYFLSFYVKCFVCVCICHREASASESSSCYTLTHTVYNFRSDG